MQQIEDSEESLGVTVAETLLARDQLKAQIRQKHLTGLLTKFVITACSSVPMQALQT